MKNIFQKSLTLAAMLSLVLFSCQKENAFESASEAVHFTSSISATRASGTTWTAKDSIGIYMYKNGTSELMNSVANFPYLTLLGDGVFKPADSTKVIYYPLQNDWVDFTAYSPYKKGIVDQKYPLDVTDQSTQQTREKSDFMLARLNTVRKSAEAKNLTFTHELSKIKLNISAGGTLTTADLKGLSIGLSGSKLKATYDMTPGVANPISFGSETNTVLNVPVNTDGTFAECMLIPQTCSALTLTFSLPLSSTKYVAQISSITLEKGKQYTYNVLLTPAVVSLTANSITDWTAGNGSGENITAPIKYGYVIGDLYPNEVAPVGVVFWLNTADPSYDAVAHAGKKGKIVSLTEGINMVWGPIVYTGAHDWEYGVNNQNLIKGIDADFSDYAPFAWCANHTAGGRSWYLPALYELNTLNGVLTDVNTSLAKVSGATTLSLENYWSSREDALATHAWSTRMGTGQQTMVKGSTFRVRAVSEF